MDVSGQVMALIQNLAFILSLGFLYNVVCRLTHAQTVARDIALGVIFGAIGILQMFTAIETSSGVFIDGRVILVLLSVLVGNVNSGLVTALILSFVRVMMGDPGVLVAIGAIFTTFLFAVTFRRFNKTPFYAFAFREQLILLGVIYLSSLPWIYLMRANVSLEDSLTLVLTGATLYPLILFLSLFILKHEVNHQTAINQRELHTEQLRNLIDFAPMPIALLNPQNYSIIYANRLFKNGSLQEDAPENNRRITDTVWQTVVKNLSNQLPLSNQEIQVNHEDGSSSWLLCSARQEMFQDQPVLMTLYQNITSKKMRETEIRTIVENSPDAIVRYDSNMNALYSNPASRQILGPLFTASQDTALKILNIYKEYVEQVIIDGIEREVDCQVEDAYGNPHYLEVRFVPEVYQNYATETVLCITRDVTEHRITQQALVHSEEMYRAILSNFPNGLVVLYDRNLQCILLNGTRLGLSNFTPQQATGKHLETIFPSSLFNRNMTHFKTVFDNISSMSVETIVDDRIYAISVVPVYGQSFAQIIAGMAIIQDISDRKRIENRLRKSELHYRTLYESVSDAIIIFRLEDEVILEVNDRALEMYGYCRDELIGMSLEQLSANAQQNKAKIEELREKGSIKNLETVQLRKDGSRMILMASASMTVYNDQPAILTVNRDITLQREREQQELDYAIAHEQTRVLSDFIREAAHEFRTPLSTIYVNLHMLRRKVDPDNQRFIESINEQAADIVKLVDSLLLMARLDSDTVFNLGKIDINETVRSILFKHKAIIDEKSLEVVTQLADNHPSVFGDQKHLGIAIEHVIENAIRFTREGDRITIVSKSVDGTVFVCVDDSGEGMDEDILSRIFDRFYRVDSAHTTRGFGLGLPISRKIIEKHGGHIDAKSTQGEGSKFIIELPSSDSVLKRSRVKNR